MLPAFDTGTVLGFGVALALLYLLGFFDSNLSGSVAGAAGPDYYLVTVLTNGFELTELDSAGFFLALVTAVVLGDGATVALWLCFSSTAGFGSVGATTAVYYFVGARDAVGATTFFFSLTT